MLRRPGCGSVVWANLNVNQIVLSTVARRHRLKRFPIDTLFVNAQATPARFVTKDLMCELVDARCGFAGAGVARDQPAATELAPLPSQSLEHGDEGGLRLPREKTEEPKARRSSGDQPSPRLRQP